MARPRKFGINMSSLSDEARRIIEAATEIMRRVDIEGKSRHIGDRVVIEGLTSDEETMLEAACIIIDRIQSKRG
jgi:hypothetical protein